VNSAPRVTEPDIHSAPARSGRFFCEHGGTSHKLPFSLPAHPINCNLSSSLELSLRLRFARCLTAFFVVILSTVPFTVAQTHPAAQSHPAPQSRGIEGNYAGTLQAGEAQLHLILHLAKSANGSLSATLDSLDQAVYAIVASSISFSGATLKLEVASVGAHFEGKVSADHQTIEGEWVQGNASLPLVFHRQAANAASRKPSEAIFPVEGIWQSALEAHGMRLRFQLHVSHDTEGELVAALDSLDQSVNGLPAVRVSLKGDNTFHFEIPSVAGIFEGSFNPAKNTIIGNWSQTGAEQQMEFKRSDQPPELRRPQTPLKPYPYREEEVTFSNTPASVTLAGTLTLPKGTGPFPAVILIAGSGPHDRDESIANHKPFLLLADYLTRKGIAVLRYDKRGIGKSTGAADSATTLDLASDTQAAVAYLKSRKDIDAAKIGLIGHSEGAMIAPYLATHSHEIAWLVLLAPPATRGEDTLLNQSELIGRVGGLSEPQLVSSLTFDREAYDLVRKEKEPAAMEDKLKALVKETGLDAATPPAVLETQLRMLTSPWFRFFLDYDPLPTLQALKTPTLALYGEKDLQVPPKANLPLIKKAFADSANTDAAASTLPDLNHLFQHAYSGSPAEYPAIEETFSPAALQLISDWILHHTQ
jgi:pimeloyl-ACP methyl ester carboxylesterase